jgi:Tfp pilus assembly protein PilN
MIAINLIPVELRKIDATPLPRRLTIFGAVALNAVALVVALTYFLANIPALQSKKENTKNQVYQATTINKVEQRHNVLITQKRDFEQRRNTIEQIEKARVIWARKLDQLWDLVPEDMWLSDIRLEEPPKSKSRRGQPEEAPKGHTFVIEGYTAGPDVTKVSAFIQALERKSAEGFCFFEDFERIELVKLGLEEEEFADYEEGVAVKFTLRLYMIPRRIELQSAAAPAAGQPRQ